MPIVRRGAPISRNVGPLQGMTFPTVEGRLKLGYHRGGRNGIGLLLPIDPTVPIPNTVPRKATVHGIGAFTRGRGLGSGASLQNCTGCSVTMRNLTTGDPSTFKVGDQWQLVVSGLDAGAPIYLNPNFNGLALPLSGQQDLAGSILLGRYIDGNAAWGNASSSGGWSVSGTFGPSQIGSWIIGGNMFTVTDAQGNITPYTGPTQAGGTPYYTLASNHPPTQPAPAPVVQTLAQQLAARGDTLAPTGQLVPVVTSTAAASGAPAPASGSAGGSISDHLVSGFSLSSIPAWGWIAAAGVGAFFLLGGHKHGA